MSWWQHRKARKELIRLGLDESILRKTENEFKQGHKELIKQRNELRKLESPTYHRLIKQINKIADSDIPLKQKRQNSFNLVIEKDNLSDYEKTDLLQQLNGIYGQSRTAQEEYQYVINSLKKIKQETDTVDNKISRSFERIEQSFIPYPDKADLMLKVVQHYNNNDSK